MWNHIQKKMGTPSPHTAFCLLQEEGTAWHFLLPATWNGQVEPCLTASLDAVGCPLSYPPNPMTNWGAERMQWGDCFFKCRCAQQLTKEVKIPDTPTVPLGQFLFKKQTRTMKPM